MIDGTEDFFLNYLLQIYLFCLTREHGVYQRSSFCDLVIVRILLLPFTGTQLY